MRSIQVSYSQSCHGPKYFISSNPLEARGIIKQIIALHKLLRNFLMLCKLSIKRMLLFIAAQRTLVFICSLRKGYCSHFVHCKVLLRKGFFFIFVAFDCTEDFVVHRLQGTLHR
jgi:hypothetical protein